MRGWTPSVFCCSFRFCCWGGEGERQHTAAVGRVPEACTHPYPTQRRWGRVPAACTTVRSQSVGNAPAGVGSARCPPPTSPRPRSTYHIRGHACHVRARVRIRVRVGVRMRARVAVGAGLG
eukprot:4921649-Prymnesium_polylepis.2